MTADEFRKMIERVEQNTYYVNLKKSIEFDNNLIHMVEQAKLRLAEMEREEMEQREKKEPDAATAYLETLAPQWRKRNPSLVTATLHGIKFAKDHYGVGEEQ